LHTFIDEINKWLPRLHGLVIGPGLGRDRTVLSNVERLIRQLRQQDKRMPLVIDADGLHLITEKPDLIREYGHCILTPNLVEFQRLQSHMHEQDNTSSSSSQCAQKLAKFLQVNILLKGHVDTICSMNNEQWLQCDIAGSPRRCGGQGDLLAGALITCYYWTLKNHERIVNESSMNDNGSRSFVDAAQIAAYAASSLIRTSCRSTFDKRGRSMISGDILEEIGPIFSRLFDTKDCA
jgi:ATP-dependent NAD(P)H-hydrate dehydratase